MNQNIITESFSLFYLPACIILVWLSLLLLSRQWRPLSYAAALFPLCLLAWTLLAARLRLPNRFGWHMLPWLTVSALFCGVLADRLRRMRHRRPNPDDD